GLFPGEKQPPGACLEFFRIFLEHLRRVMLRVDADRVDEDVTAYPVPQDLLDLAQPGRLEAGFSRPSGGKEGDRHHLSLQEIGKKAHAFSLLGYQAGVGKIGGPPNGAAVAVIAAGCSRGGCRAQSQHGCADEEKGNDSGAMLAATYLHVLFSLDTRVRRVRRGRLTSLRIRRFAKHCYAVK